MKKIFVQKASGDKEEFDVRKLETSLLLSKAPRHMVEKVIDFVQNTITDGVTTGQLYRLAFEKLREFERPVAARYSLKRAIAELGPTGFPFEKYIASIFKDRGFETLTDQIVQGHCVEHEMDVIAWNDEKLIMCEVKFHNEPGLKSDLKVALYIKARFEDLQSMEFTFGGKKRKLDEGWLITNTKFTDKAIQFSECAGVKLIGWSYPSVGNLHDIIEKIGLHPVTSLTTLSNKDKNDIIRQGLVLCSEVSKNTNVLREIGISEEKISEVVDECVHVCPVL